MFSGQLYQIVKKKKSETTKLKILWYTVFFAVFFDLDILFEGALWLMYVKHILSDKNQ